MTDVDEDLQEIIEEVVDNPHDERLIKQILEYENKQLTKSQPADIFGTLDGYVEESLRDR